MTDSWGQRRYKYLVLGIDKIILWKKKNSDSAEKLSENDIKMLQYLIDNIFVMLGGHVFQHSRQSYGY
jgi:hypothetical protein